MNLVIHNLENLNIESCINRLVYFNPWGFSRAGIEKSLIEVLKSEQVPEELIIYFCIKDLFFGRRSQIALNAITKIYPKNRLIKISETDLLLFLNNSSI